MYSKNNQNHLKCTAGTKSVSCIKRKKNQPKCFLNYFPTFDHCDSYMNQYPFLIPGVRNLPKIEKKGSKPGSRKLSKDGGASGGSGAAAGAAAASEDTEVKNH